MPLLDGTQGIKPCKWRSGMNIEVCKQCPRQHCWLCFDFGDVTPYEKLFGMGNGRTATVTTFEDFLHLEIKMASHFVIEQKNGIIKVSKYMEMYGPFLDWDECIRYGYPFIKYVEEAVLKKDDKCLCYAEHLVYDLNKENG